MSTVFIYFLFAQNLTVLSIIYDNIIYNLKKLLVNDQRVMFLQRNGLITLKVMEQYLLRFKKLKKLDENHKSSNVKTKQNTLFLNQGKLFELEPKLTNLEIGYVLSPIESNINGVFIVCPKGDKSNVWEFDLDNYLVNKSQPSLFKSPAIQEEKVQRFKVKKHENKDGTIQKEKRS